MARKGQKFNKYTVEFRQQIVQEYLSGVETQGSLSRKYGVPCDTISTWIKAYRKGIPIGQQKKGRQKGSEIDYKERYEILKKYQAFIEARRERK